MAPNANTPNKSDVTNNSVNSTVLVPKGNPEFKGLLLFANLRKTFVELAACNSVQNETAANFYFFNLLGAYFKDSVIRVGSTGKDLRFPVFWIQRSRTGKDQLNKVLQDVALNLGMDCVTITDISGDAALVGSFDYEAEKYNRENKLTPDEPIRETKKKTFVYRDPIIKGELAIRDLIIVSEGKLLTQNKSEKLLTILQPAMDFPGLVYKKMKSDIAIEYPCKASLVITSIPFKEMKKSVIEQGFYQRTMLLIRKLDNIDKIMEMRIEADKLKNPKYQEKYNTLKKQFLTIMQKFTREKRELTIDPSAVKYIKEQRDNVFNQIRNNVTGEDILNLLSFTQTIEEMIIKIGAQCAIIDNSNTINYHHVRQSVIITRDYLTTIIKQLEIQVEKEQTSREKKYLQLANKLLQSPLTKTEFIAESARYLGMGLHKTREQFYDYLLNRNYIIEENVQEKNKKLVRLRR